MPPSADTLSVVVLGASGAVGSEAVKALLAMPAVAKVTLLNRRALSLPESPRMSQHIVDPLDPASYRHLLAGHTAAICTLGVGQPSKVSKDELVRIDKTAALEFARACKDAGVQRFELLSAVGADPKSSNHYLRTKGELRDALQALDFARLSSFQPSMILTPTNRYDRLQGMLLAVWPRLSPVLGGGLSKYRGIKVETLGAAMALNLVRTGRGFEVLHWSEMTTLTGRAT